MQKYPVWPGCLKKFVCRINEFIVERLSENTDNSAKTYLYDRLRAPFTGICESTAAIATLIAIRGFGAQEGAEADTVKSLLNASHFIGLLLTTIFIALIGRTGWRATNIVSCYLLICGALLIAAGCSTGLIAFTVCYVAAYIIFAQQTPMMIHTYANNYSPSERGKKVSTVMVTLAGASALFSYLGSMLLDWKLSWFPAVLIAMGVACFINAYLVRKIPSQPLVQSETGNPLRSLGLPFKDKLFGWLLMSWMLMGFANLMSIPIRVELLANPEYDYNVSNEQVLLATMVIPQIAGLLSGKAWGALFDRMNFIAWRISVNSCFFIGMVLYFSGLDLWVVYAGAMFLGLGMGGGRIGWNLWVTKIAPVDKVSAYMSVHTMFTGLRGVMAPFIGYLIASMAIQAVGWLSAGLIVVSCIMFALLRKNERFSRVL